MKINSNVKIYYKALCYINSNINVVLPLFLLAESIKDINLADCKMVGV